MSGSGAGRGGFTSGDALLALAGVVLVLALGYPWIDDAMVRRRADAVARDVEDLRGAAVRYHEVKGGWPEDGPAGEVPPELAPFVSADLRMAQPSHRLDWERWELVEEAPPAPALDQPPDLTQQELADSIRAPEPRFGAIAGLTVHTADPRVLGLLLERYGAERSFSRDSSWTLVLAVDTAS